MNDFVSCYEIKKKWKEKGISFQICLFQIWFTPKHDQFSQLTNTFPRICYYNSSVRLILGTPNTIASPYYR